MEGRNIIIGVIVVTVTITQIFANYVYYPNNYRKCIPILNCEPGHAIQPCVNEHDEDLCVPCREGMVQPDLISSTGNHTETSCFKPEKECLAHDITYQRYPTKTYCEYLNGCKCKLSECFYGDPCLCTLKKDGCGIGKQLNESGDCVDCPPGTEKNDTGCGPCRRVTYIPPGNRASSAAENPHKRTSISAPMSIVEATTLSPTSVVYMMEPEGSSSSWMIAITCLGVLVLILLVAVIALCITKRSPQGVILWGMCWSSIQHNTRDEEAHQIPDRQQAQPLIKNKNCDIPRGETIDQSKTVGDNLKTGQTENGNPERYRNPSTSDSLMSGSSGFNDDDDLDTQCVDAMTHNSAHLENVGIERSKDELSHSTNFYNESEIESKLKLLEKDLFDSNEDIADDSKVRDKKSSKEGSQRKVNLYLSENKSPVTTESEPPIELRRLTLRGGRKHCVESMGHQSINSSENNGSSRLTETLPSAIEAYSPTLKGQEQFFTQQIFHTKDQYKKDETNVKVGGPNSWSSQCGDSGIHIP